MDSSKSPQPLKKSRTSLSGMDDHQLENDEFPSETDKGQDEFGEDNSPSLQNSIGPNYRGSPCIGAFTIQCAKCFKWRLIPTKEKYEEIREHIIQDPFDCERAREWRPDVTCDDPEDISQDGSRLWAIDKPNIAQPPTGWERQIRIRGEGGTKFADVYYTAPTGRKLRSLVEVDRFRASATKGQRMKNLPILSNVGDKGFVARTICAWAIPYDMYLSENPHYATQGVALAQFSFQIPRPLRQNYVKKRPKIASDEAMPKPLQTVEANPIAWAAPPTHEGQTIGLASGADEPLGSEVELVRKAKAERSPSSEAKTNHVSDGLAVKSENAQNGDASTTPT